MLEVFHKIEASDVNKIRYSMKFELKVLILHVGGAPWRVIGDVVNLQEKLKDVEGLIVTIELKGNFSNRGTVGCIHYPRSTLEVCREFDHFKQNKDIDFGGLV
ncbi:hypothetical protein P8452_23203 [Trifolium repens]|nr:hypothetical protein P8452_23203 [Trifolium repens]